MFKLGPQSPQVKNTGGKAKSTQATRQWDEPMSASAEHPAKAPNSAQRRSAKRMEKFIQAKERNLDRNPSEAAAIESTAAGGPQADPVERNDCAAPMEVEQDRRGHKRAASETQAASKSPAPAAAIQQQPQPQPQQDSTVETTAPPAVRLRERSESPPKRQTSPGRRRQTASESPAEPQPAKQQPQQPAAAKKPAAAALSLARRGVEPTPMPTPFHVPPWPRSGKGGGRGGGFTRTLQPHVAHVIAGYGGGGYGGAGYGGGGCRGYGGI